MRSANCSGVKPRQHNTRADQYAAASRVYKAQPGANPAGPSRRKNSAKIKKAGWADDRVQLGYR